MRFKHLRIALLLVVLVLVVHHYFNDRARITRWDSPLFIAIYPVNADGSRASQQAIEALDVGDFDYMRRFMHEQGSRFGLELERPIYIDLGEPITDPLPQPPISGNFLARASWIMQVRWWRWRFDEQGLDPDIIVLARFFDPDSTPRLNHSTGLQQIRVAIANVFAARSMQPTNQVVILHEILHTLGASDKYDLQTGVPDFPAGYANPEQQPLYPQQRAEIMAGRIPLGPNAARQAESLARVVIGPQTAAEIGWRSSSEVR